jgi:EpsI family protein
VNSGKEKWLRFFGAVVLMSATAAMMLARNRVEVGPPYDDLQNFPQIVAGRVSVDVPLSPEVLESLGPGHFLMREYRGGATDAPTNLYIAFFPSQRTGDTIHSPRNCLPGAGWVPTESGRIWIPTGTGKSIEANRYIVTQGLDRMLVLYWYQSHGRVTPSEYWAKYYLVTDSLWLKRTDGALVRVITAIGRNEDASKAEARAVKFSEAILPNLNKYIPD